MKATGIIRRVDELGRIVIPKEIRRSMKINNDEEMECFVDKDLVCFKKVHTEPDYSDSEKFVTKNMAKTECVIPRGEEVEVIFIDGRKATVVQNPDCKYNLSVAIVRAFKQAGFNPWQVGGYPNWVD